MDKLNISIDEKGKIEILMNGLKVYGARSIEFYWEVGEIPTHKIEFVTQAAEIK
jgi:hypothetical protein